MLTVKDIKKLLDQYPDDMPVGVVGWFGELNNLNETDFNVRDAYVIPEGQSWRTAPDINVKVLQIITPDIGPEPD